MDTEGKSIYTFLMDTIFLSETANPLLKTYLEEQGYKISVVEATDKTYEPVNSHPDMYMCSLGHGKEVFFGCPEKLGYRYPENIRYNAACTGKFFIHNLDYTDENLKKAAENMEFIHVSQGYTKCSTLIVDENSIITSDGGIYKACYGKLDVLWVRPGFIKLKNFPSGFIGGASGRVGDTIVFNGNLEGHPDCEEIASFIRSRGLNFEYFTKYDLEDIGSIIVNPASGEK